MDNQSAYRIPSERDTGALHDCLELAEREAANRAARQLLDRHIDTVLDLRSRFPLDNLDLLSSMLAGKDIPEAVREQIGGLHEKIRCLIHEVALRIENRRYCSLEKGVNEMSLSYKHRQNATALTQGYKAIAISCQTIKCAVNLFAQFNEAICKECEQSELEGNTQNERRLILANAILVYELTDFVIGYLGSFKMNGRDVVTELCKRMLNEADELQRREEALRREAHTDDKDPIVREHVLNDIENRLQSIEVLRREWEEHRSSIDIADSQLRSVTKLIPTLKLLRENARNQLGLLQTGSITAIVRNSLEAIKAASITLQNLKLVPLTPDRVRRLIKFN